MCLFWKFSCVTKKVWFCKVFPKSARSFSQIFSGFLRFSGDRYLLPHASLYLLLKPLTNLHSQTVKLFPLLHFLSLSRYPVQIPRVITRKLRQCNSPSRAKTGFTTRPAGRADLVHQIIIIFPVDCQLQRQSTPEQLHTPPFLAADRHGHGIHSQNLNRFFQPEAHGFNQHRPAPF